MEDEAGALLNISRDEIVSLVETGELAGLRIAGHWRIPLKSITALLATINDALNAAAKPTAQTLVTFVVLCAVAVLILVSTLAIAVLDLLQEVNAAGQTILVVTHDDGIDLEYGEADLILVGSHCVGLDWLAGQLVPVIEGWIESLRIELLIVENAQSMHPSVLEELRCLAAVEHDGVRFGPKLLPVGHAGDMILIDRILSFDDEQIHALATVKPDGLFNREDGALPAWVRLPLHHRLHAQSHGPHQAHEFNEQYRFAGTVCLDLELLV